MAIKAKIAGSYQDVAGVFVKRSGVYEAVAGMFAKVGGAYTSAFSSLPPLVPFDFDRIVTIGDSITSHLFDVTSEVLTAQRYILLKYGKTVTIQPQAVSGSRTADALTIIDGILAGLPGGETVLFYVNIGFNDVSALRPYADTASSYLTALDTDYRDLLTRIINAGHKLIVGSVHFGHYGITSGSPNYYDNPEIGSLPFNQNVFIPAINALSPESINTDGRPVLDLYRLDYNDMPVLVREDGIHYQLSGQRYQRYWIIDRIFEWASGVRPSTVSLGSDPRTKTYQPARLLVSFDDPDLSVNPSPGAIKGWNAFDRTLFPVTNTLLDVDGNPSAISITWPASGLVSYGGGYGVSSTVPTLDVLTPSATKQYWTVASGGNFDVSFSGFNAGQSVALRIVSSRNHTTVYTTKFTVNGVAHTVVSSSTTAAPYIDISATADSGGVITINVSPDTGSGYGFINAIELVPSWA